MIVRGYQDLRFEAAAGDEISRQKTISTVITSRRLRSYDSSARHDDHPP